MFEKLNKAVLLSFGEQVGSNSGLFTAIVDFAEVSGKLGGFKKDYTKMELVAADDAVASLTIGSQVTVHGKAYRVADKFDDGGGMVRIPLTDPTSGSAPENTDWTDF
ncbi:MAG: hypothetical protein GY718_16875 [Lentisphaerae bacterium]|nr:hypothetical protein [Lentisphaerota bacterium]